VKAALKSLKATQSDEMPVKDQSSTSTSDIGKVIFLARQLNFPFLCNMDHLSVQIENMSNIVFKHPIALIYLLYTYISVLNTTYYLVTLLPHDMFQPYTAIIRCWSI
jgi:hypothetical protein